MKNFIHDIEIKNFKSIRHQKITDCRRINLFIGYPNAGKSNILEAIGLFSMNQEGSFDTNKNPSSPNKFTFNQICRISEPIDLFYNKNYKDELFVSINNRFVLQLQEPDDFNALHFQNIIPDGNQVNDHLIATLLSSINVNTRDYWIRWNPTQAFVKDEIYNRIKIYLYKQQSQLKSNDFASLNMPYGNNLAQIISTNDEVRLLFIDLLRQNNLKPHAITGKYGVAKELSNGVVVTFDSSLVADTINRLLFHEAAIQTNQNSILLFEEPEAHMFPPYISKLTGEIIYNENGNQYFITTHSPFVINDFLEDARQDLSVYVVGYKEGATTIKRLTDEELHEIYQYGVDLFFNIEDYVSNG